MRRKELSNKVSIPEIIRAARALKRAQSHGLPAETIDQLSHALIQACMAGMSQPIPGDITDTACTEVLQAMLAVTPKDGGILGGVVDTVLAQGSAEWLAKFLEEEDLVIVRLPPRMCARFGAMVAGQCMLMGRKAWEDLNAQLEQSLQSDEATKIFGIISKVVG